MRRLSFGVFGRRRLFCFSRLGFVGLPIGRRQESLRLLPQSFRRIYRRGGLGGCPGCDIGCAFGLIGLAGRIGRGRESQAPSIN